MAHFPDFATFSELAKTADYVPVYRRVLSDVLTPGSAFHKIDDGGCACLFVSVIGGEKVGRYSFLAARPFMMTEARRPDLQTFSDKSSATYVNNDEPMPADDPLGLLRYYLKCIRVAN